MAKTFIDFNEIGLLRCNTSVTLAVFYNVTTVNQHSHLVYCLLGGRRIGLCWPVLITALALDRSLSFNLSGLSGKWEY